MRSTPRYSRRRKKAIRRPILRRPPWWRSWLYAAVVLAIVAVVLRLPGDAGGQAQGVLAWMVTAQPDLRLGDVLATRSDWLAALPVLGQRHETQWGDLKGTLIAPVVGEVCSPFGWRNGPQGELEFHEGTDYSLVEPVDILSVADGIVTAVRSSPIYGPIVIVDHGSDVESMYGRLDVVAVEEGDAVRAGDVLGTAGPGHVHFELRYRDIAIDPASWFSQ